MIFDPEDVIKIHKILVEQFGGSHGLRDRALLEAALQRRESTFDQKELHPDPLNKCAALLESIIKNHPFNDGNKRIGYTLSRMYLLSNHYDLTATELKRYDFIISIASGKETYESIVDWLRNNIHEE